MAFKYLEHEADVGLEAEGATLEEAFCEGAKATFNIMVDIKEVAPKKRVDIYCEADSIPSLFIQWLNELLSQADLNSMFFSRFEMKHVRLTGQKDAEKWVAEGAAFGEAIDTSKHKLKTEAKAATYYGLKYETKGKKHIFRCVIDV